jgi:hypothetical protein
MTTERAQEIYDMLINGKIEKPRRMLKESAPKHQQNYIVSSYIFNQNKDVQDYRNRYYKHLESAQRFAFLQRMTGRQVDIFDNINGKFI